MPVQGSDALKRRVLAEYPAALAQLEDRYGSMHGTARYHEIRRPAGKASVEKSLKFAFAFAPSAAKLAIRDEEPADPTNPGGKKITEKVYGVNPTYGFQLIRSRPGDEFVLRNFSDDLKQGRITIGNYHGGEIQCAFSFGAASMSLGLDPKVYRIDSVDEVGAADGGKHLLIQFTSATPPKTPRSPTLYSVDGWVVVSPSEGWIMREYGRVTTRELNGVAVTDVGRIEYAQSPDGHLDPVRLVNRYYKGRISREKPDEGLPGFQFELDFESVKYDALPEAEFRLPAFGLPEIDPAGKKGAATDRPYGLFALAAAGLGVAGGLKYASARLRRA